MSDAKPSLEIIAPTVQEAIARGASELGLPEEKLEVEVLDEGSSGLFGLGSRQARVRLTIRSEPGEAEAPEAPRAAEEAPEEAVELEAEEPEGGDPEAVRIARDTVEELLEHLGIEATITAAWGPKPTNSRIWPLLVDVQGKDLSVLIGRRGETLSALQYITRLIVGKELRRPVAVVIDVAGYRKRRERQIRRLARRMAQQALERSRTMVLEPMPANERRIVHVELRENPDVTTESIGEGKNRKVTIIPAD
jgi:spoIIIJ-associated protein